MPVSALFGGARRRKIINNTHGNKIKYQGRAVYKMLISGRLI
jgi:hypothetical protein